MAAEEVATEVAMVHALQDAGKYVQDAALAAPNHAVHSVLTTVVEDVSNIVRVTVLVIVMVALIHVKIPVKGIVQEDALVVQELVLVVLEDVLVIVLEIVIVFVIAHVQIHAKVNAHLFAKIIMTKNSSLWYQK